MIILNSKIYKSVKLLLINTIFHNYRNIIPISYALNNGNFYPTLISITSVLENSNNLTYYNIYLLISKNKKEFSKKNKINFKNIQKLYNNCKISIVEINDILFKYAKIKKYPVATYYRLLIAKLLKNIDKIIYLDGDTLVFTDLTEMFNLNMKNNIILGFIDDSSHLAKLFGITTYKYITAGVLLINLKAMRKEHITEKLFNFMKKNSKQLIQEDQTILNIVLYKRIGLLPPKFGIWNFLNKMQLLNHNNYIKKGHNCTFYKKKEIINAYNNPGIIHFVYRKPYKAKNYLLKSKYNNMWFYYAKKTNRFNEIVKYYNFTFHNKE